MLTFGWSGSLDWGQMTTTSQLRRLPKSKFSSNSKVFSSPSLAWHSTRGCNCFRRGSPPSVAEPQLLAHGEPHPTPPEPTEDTYIASYATQYSFSLAARLVFTDLSRLCFGNCFSHGLIQITHKSTKLWPCSWKGQWKAELEMKAWNDFRKIMFVSVSDDLALLSLNEVLAIRMESFHCPREAYTLSQHSQGWRNTKSRRDVRQLRGLAQSYHNPSDTCKFKTTSTCVLHTNTHSQNACPPLMGLKAISIILQGD